MVQIFLLHNHIYMQLYKGVPIITLFLQFLVRHFKIDFLNMTVGVNIVCFDLAHDLSPGKVQALPHNNILSGKQLPVEMVLILCLFTNVRMVFESFKTVLS